MNANTMDPNRIILCHRFAAAYALALRLVLLVVASASAATAVAQLPKVAAGKKQLWLEHGSFSKGQLRPSQQPGCFAWLADGFSTPFDFQLRDLRFIAPVKQDDHTVETSAAQLFELAGGGLIAGDLQSVDQDWVSIDSPLVGPINLRRDSVLTIVDATYAGKIIYTGPRSDGRWTSVARQADWKFVNGMLSTDRAGGTVVGDVGLPAKCRIHLSLGWKVGVPDFVIALGTDRSSQEIRPEDAVSAASIEVWDSDLAIVRHCEPPPALDGEPVADAETDFQMLTSLEKGATSLELVVYLDQIAGRVIACDEHGRRLAEMLVPPLDDRIHTAVHISNTGANLTLRDIEIREWDGLATQGGGVATVVMKDGKLAGTILGFDAETQQIILATEQGEVRHPLADLRRGELARSTSASSKRVIPPEESEADPPISLKPMDSAPSPPIELLLIDRSRIEGELRPSSSDKLVFRPVQSNADIEVAVAHVLGLAGIDHSGSDKWPSGRRGTLKIEGSELAGCLTEFAPGDAPQKTLAWHPRGSRNASVLAPIANGAVVYRAAIPKPEKIQQPQPQVRRDLFFRRSRQPNVSVPEKEVVRVELAAQPQISFRTGDIISGTVSRIDEAGIHFQSPQSTTTTATHGQVQSLTLAPMNSGVTIEQSKFDRLMTVPRMMKDDPPSQLFISPSGDFLRGRLVSYLGKTLKIGVGVETVEIAANKIAKIVWLHDRDWSEGSEQEMGKTVLDQTNTSFMVHAIRSGDRGLTFAPTELVDGAIRGKSQLLGDCSVVIEELEQLLFGSSISERVREYRDDPWKLSLAQLPRVFANAAAGYEAGQQSVLVGNPAPQFSLRGLDGEPFFLADAQSRVIVLDFWASWCGPCMHSMPAIEGLISELADKYGSDSIELVAVNIQESAAKARTAVERLEIQPTVVLDTDGGVAAAYAARSIPQTVVIDTAGNITHVFVGGGSRTLSQLRTALEALLTH